MARARDAAVLSFVPYESSPPSSSSSTERMWGRWSIHRPGLHRRRRRERGGGGGGGCPDRARPKTRRYFHLVARHSTLALCVVFVFSSLQQRLLTSLFWLCACVCVLAVHRLALVLTPFIRRRSATCRLRAPPPRARCSSIRNHCQTRLMLESSRCRRKRSEIRSIRDARSFGENSFAHSASTY